MEEPGVIADRLRNTAKDTVDQARAIAKDSIAEAADTNTYTAAKMIDGYAKAVDLAVTSGFQAAKDVLGIVPPPATSAPESQTAEGRRLVADAMEAISRRMMRQSSAVAQTAADELDKNPGAPSVWAKSMVKMADILLLGGIELAETALIGPAPYERDPKTSVIYAVNGNGKRKLKIMPPGLIRPGTLDPIPEAQIRFYKNPVYKGPNTNPTGDLAINGILENGENEFFIAVAPVGVVSGVYVGDVDVVPLDAKGDEGAAVDTVNVEVPL